MTSQQIEIMREKNPFMALNDIVYEILLQEIMNFRIQPGSRISENNIAKELGVSRSPVKAALEKLQIKNYITVQNNRYYAAVFSSREYENITDFAVMLDSYAAGEAAVKITPAQLEELYSMGRRLQKLYRRSIDGCVSSGYHELLDTELEFHTYIVKVADNELLTGIYDELKYKLFRYRAYLLFSPPAGIYEMLENDHVVLCDTLSLGDREVAAAAAKRHLSISRAVIARHGLMNMVCDDR
ncbi:MAG: GntR family transcriptional regulator [Oscillospiraceae bacterium]|nr:GntR family transcriptional regulator [Oscillospiraceae bacterium]